MSETAAAVRHLDGFGNWSQWAVSLGMSGFLMLMGVLSFPLPWTPVPFSMMPFGLLVAGAAQRPLYSFVSIAIYLLAGGLGAPVFAGGESGFIHFGGNTAGYLIGFLLVGPIVSWYMREPRALLNRNWAIAATVGVGGAMIAGIASIWWMWANNESFASLDGDMATWGITRSALWIVIFLTASATVGVLVWLGRKRDGSRLANLFLVMLFATICLHALGVTVLWLASSLSLFSAIILGSIVFLPFDIIKASLAVALTIPFLPEESHA